MKWMKYLKNLPEKKVVWSIVALYVLLIFITLGDVVMIMDFAQRNLGDYFNPILGVSPYFFLAAFLTYITFIKKEKRPSRYIFLILIVVCFFFIMRLLYYPAEKVHLIEYGILGALVFWAVSIHKVDIVFCYVAAIIVSLVVGSADEIVQGFLPFRVFDFRDIVVNNLSGALGAVIYAGFFREGVLKG